MTETTRTSPASRTSRVVATPTATSKIGDFDTLPVLRGSFDASMAARNRAPKTRALYGAAIASLDTYLREQGMPTRVPNIRREHLEAYFADRLASKKVATVNLEYRAIRVFWRWLLDEEEVDVDVMAKMKAPRVFSDPPPVLSDEQLRRLISACEGRDFFARRDMALLLMFIDTGARLSEVALMMVEDVGFGATGADVVIRAANSKVRRGRSLPLDSKTERALRKYLRARAAHSRGGEQARDGHGRPMYDSSTTEPLHPLWLGLSGPMTSSGVSQALVEIGKRAGIRIHAHLFRHTKAHRWQADDANTGDLMSTMGWESPAMLRRYGASAAGERAKATQRRLGLVDRL